MTTEGSGNPTPGDSLGAPDESRGGPTFDDAVDNAESGSQVEGVHTPSGEAAPGESRVEQMPEVDGVTEGRVDGDPGAPSDPPEPGPAPGDIGSGGEAVPDGPPFDTDSDTDTDSEGPSKDTSGAGAEQP